MTMLPRTTLPADIRRTLPRDVRMVGCLEVGVRTRRSWSAGEDKRMSFHGKMPPRIQRPC
eukprot:656605-Prymnesium_polylepis.1